MMLRRSLATLLIAAQLTLPTPVTRAQAPEPVEGEAGTPPEQAPSETEPDETEPELDVEPVTEAPGEEASPVEESEADEGVDDALDEEAFDDEEDEILGVGTSPDERAYGATARLSIEDVFRAGGSVASLDEATLSRLRYDDPMSVVTRVPGVTVRHEDGFGLRPNIGIRGTNPERSRSVTLMEDGVLFGPAPYSAPAAYYFPLIGRIAGVDVFKGPAAIQFGPQTVGGAIDFITRDVPRTQGGAVDFAYGSYGTRRLHLHYGRRFEHFGFLVEAIDVGSLGFKHIDGLRDSTGFSRTEAVVRTFVQSRATRHVYHRLDLKLMYGRERSNETYLGITEADFALAPDRRYIASAEDVMRTQRFSYQLTHRLEVGTRIRLTTTLYRHDYVRRWHRFDRFGVGGPDVAAVLGDPTTGTNRVYYDLLRGAEDSDPTHAAQRILYANNDRTMVSQGAQSSLRFEAETGAIRHQLTAGVRIHYDHIDRDHTSESYLVSLGRLLRDDTPAIQTADSRASTLAIAMHAAYALEYGRVRLTPGMRTEIMRMGFDDRATGTSQDATHHVVLGGFGANVRLVDWLNAYAGVHRGFGPVAPGQVASIDPELSVDTEFGLRMRDESLGVRAELGAYVNRYSNMLLFCTGAGGCAPEDIGMQFNAGEALVAGLEGSYEQLVSLPKGFTMPLRVTYAYQRSRFLNDFTSADPQYRDVREGHEIPYLPRHQASLQAGVEHERFRVTLAGTFTAKMREQAGIGDEGFFTDPVAILDLVGDVRVQERVRLTLRIENLTNARPIVAHRPLGVRPYRPLMAMAGIHIDL